MDVCKERIKEERVGVSIAFPHIDCIRDYRRLYFLYVFISILPIPILGPSGEQQANQYPAYRRMGGP